MTSQQEKRSSSLAAPSDSSHKSTSHKRSRSQLSNESNAEIKSGPRYSDLITRDCYHIHQIVAEDEYFRNLHSENKSGIDPMNDSVVFFKHLLGTNKTFRDYCQELSNKNPSRPSFKSSASSVQPSLSTSSSTHPYNTRFRIVIKPFALPSTRFYNTRSRRVIEPSTRPPTKRLRLESILSNFSCGLPEYLDDKSEIKDDHNKRIINTIRKYLKGEIRALILDGDQLRTSQALISGIKKVSNDFHISIIGWS